MAAIDGLIAEACNHYKQQRLSEAEGLAEAILQRDPRNLDAMRLLGVIARETDRLDVSADALQSAVELAAQDPQQRLMSHPTLRAGAVLCFELSATHRQAQRLDEAIETLEKALHFDPSLQEAYVNLSGMLENRGQVAEALPLAHKAVQLKPACPTAHYNLGNILRIQGDLHAAIDCYRRCLAVAPNHAKAHMNLSVCLLLHGHFREGWDEYEWREPAGEVTFDRCPQPRWDGRPLPQGTLLVHAEQGIGDEIMFASCLPDVVPLVGRCLLTCDPRLLQLFERSFPAATIVSHHRKKDWQPAAIAEPVDFQIPAGGLPLHFRSDRASFPQRDKYLLPDPQAVQSWRQRYEQLGSGPKIGISWRAGGKPEEHRKRTMSLDQLRGVLTQPGVHFVNLQYGDALDELRQVHRDLGVQIHDFEEGDPLVDLDQFAAKVAALDLVISVGNATVHMAGALGIETWAMVSALPAWRWLIAGDQMPWYSSVTLFRQAAGGSWRQVLEQISVQLRERFDLEEPTAGVGHDSTAGVSIQSAERSSRVFNMQASGNQWCEQEITAAFNKGLKLHQSGDLQQAEAIYREILLHAPRYADALHLLGVVGQQTGRLDLAISSMRRAIAVCAGSAVMHYNLAAAYKEARRIDDAIREYNTAIRLKPALVEGHLNLAAIFQEQGRDAEAAGCFHEVLAIDPQHVDAHLGLGRVLHKLCQLDAAIEHCSQAVKLRPDLARAHSALGVILMADERLSEAEHSFTQAVRLDPNYAAAHTSLGNIYRLTGRPSQAIACYRESLACDPRSFETTANLASVLQSTGEFAQAAELYRRALEIKPTSTTVLPALGMLLHDLGRYDEAQDAYQSALKVDPKCARAHVNRGLLMIEQGRLAEGWDEYEWRWRLTDETQVRHHAFFPAWDGSSLDGKTILVHSEQGVGDEVMFGSCLPDLMQACRHCVVTCNDRLARLLARSFPGATVLGIPRGQESRWRPPKNLRIDCQIAIGSLPRFMRRNLEAFPQRTQYLTPDAQLVSSWRARFAALGDGLKVGISWRGGKRQEDRVRRWTALAEWRPILETPGIQVVNLQYGDCDADLAQAWKDCDVTVHDLRDADPLGDLDAFAAKVAALDLVISVGNATVHLAGAMGRPTWCLLPCHGAWRWMHLGDRTPWYPSVQPIRQPHPGDWSAVLNQAASMLPK